METRSSVRTSSISYNLTGTVLVCLEAMLPLRPRADREVGADETRFHKLSLQEHWCIACCGRTFSGQRNFGQRQLIWRRL